MTYIYINGNFFKKDAATISVFDRGVLYGDGIFETLRSYNGKIFALDAHINRLYESAKKIFISLPLTQNRLKDDVLKTLNKNCLTDGYIRITVTRGIDESAFDISSDTMPTVIIITKPITPYPSHYYTNGVTLLDITSNKPLGNIKSISFLHHVLAKAEAKKKDAHEAIFVNHKGNITEGSISNIFMVKNNEIKTPPLCGEILPGVTRQIVMSTALDSGFIVTEDNIGLNELLSADECFITNSLMEIMPIKEVHKKRIWEIIPGKLTKLLIKKYKELTRK